MSATKGAPTNISTVEQFAVVVADVMKARGITIEQLQDPKKKRTPNGFPEALALALENAGLRTKDGASWDAKNVSKYYKARQADNSLFPALEVALSKVRAEQSEHEEQKEHLPEKKDADRSEPSLPSKPSDRSAPLTREDVTEICREMITEMTRAQAVPTVQTVQASDALTLPPESGSLRTGGIGGPRELRQYEKLSATVDSVLFELFRSECKERSLSAGKMLDAILWNRYGRPELSYQRPDAEERARARPTRSRTERGKQEE